MKRILQSLISRWPQPSPPPPPQDPGRKLRGSSSPLPPTIALGALGCVHQVLEAQGQKTPDAVALSYGNSSLTYEQLHTRADRLAHTLQALGVGAPRDLTRDLARDFARDSSTGDPSLEPSLVGVCVDRSLALGVALLGVLKTGGAYVPLDPGHPIDRLQYILEQAQVSVILTQAHLADRFQGQGLRVMVVDAEGHPEAVPHPLPPWVPPLCQPQDLAYVIYTSGSTGKPKGVQVTHQGVVNFLVSMVEKPGLRADDRVLAITTPAFDIAVLEIFGPWLVGAQVIMAPREVALDGYALSQWLQDQAITLMQATPATWRMLLGAGWQGTPRLKMLCGGEALSRELADRLLSKGASLWNMYGPTETTVWSGVGQVQPGTEGIVLGDPIANTQFYVLDEQRELVPVGVSGEWYIGGLGLARGYIHRPDLTAERFVPHPFRAEPGARLYRTGDRVRYRQDGSLEFLGRMDYQVKIRGFRIELGEVESVLRQHPALREVVVIDREDTPGDRRLVAYVVPGELKPEPLASGLLTSGSAQPPTPIAPSPLPSLTEMRLFLQRQLPDYMLPSAFVVLESLPLNPNGKVDRRALPPPNPNTRSSSLEFIPPQTPLEIQLSDLWAQVLQRDRVGLGDNFFELGGHSLLAIQLVAQIRSTLGIDLPLVQLFQNPTLGVLAQILSHQEPEPGIPPTAPSALVPLKSQGSRPPFFIINSTGQAQSLSNLLHPEQPVYSLNMFCVRSALDDLLPKAKDAQGSAELLPRLADLFFASLKAIHPHGPYHLLGYCQDGPLTLELAQRLRSHGDDVAGVYLLDSPFQPYSPRLHHRLYSLYRMGWPYLLDSWQRLAKRYRHPKGQPNPRQVATQLSPQARLDLLGKESKDQLFYALYLNCVDHYQPAPYGGSVKLLLSTEWHFVDRSHLDRITQGRLQVIPIQSSHNKLFTEPFIRELAACLDQCLGNTP